jgi:hypothetical protein
VELQDGATASGRPPRRPILVTGAIRSGTGWVGQVLAASPTPIGYIWEPFSVRHRPGTLDIRWRHWFPYICDENAAPYIPAIEQSLRFDYRTSAELRSIRKAKDAGRMGRDWYRWWMQRRRGAAPLYKDPIAVFSAEWLAQRFGMDVVVTIRHPCAFASSIKRLHWAYTKRFGDLLDQPLLMRDFLSGYEDQLRAYSEHDQDIVDQAILLWNIQNKAVARHAERHASDWVFVRLEDLAFEPVPRFQDVFARLGVRWSEEVEELVRRTSAASNPVVAARPDSIHRDSAAHARDWKRTLTAEEIARVREGTEQLWSRFYTAEDW